jgi:hypothetical protein
MLPGATSEQDPGTESAWIKLLFAQVEAAPQLRSASERIPPRNFPQPVST